MNKKLRFVLIVIVAIIILSVVGTLSFKIINDKTRLSSKERDWISNNYSAVISVNTINDLDVFGNNGKGLFYDFLKDLSDEYGLKINNVTYNLADTTVEDGFVSTNTVDDKLVKFYEDHYVLLSKDNIKVNNINEISGNTIGILKDNYIYLNGFLGGIPSITYKQFDTRKDLLDNFDNDLEYILVPRYEYLSIINEKNYRIIYHFSDIKRYYGYKMKDTYFSSILNKYFLKWEGKNLEKSFDENLKLSLVSGIKLNDVEINELNSKVYNYGFINNGPYEILSGGSYGGIVSVYLKRFSEMSGIEFKYTKYRTYKLLTNAINDGSIDVYFNYYTLTNDYSDIDTKMNITYAIAAKDSNRLVVNSIQSLMNNTVYVLQDSVLYNYLKEVENITINTYKNVSELKKINKNDGIVVLDLDSYLNYANDELSSYSLRYVGNTNNTYKFRVKNEGPFYRLFKAFIETQDPLEVKISGIYNYNKTLKSGTIIGTIAKYSIYLILIVIIVLFILYKSSKKIKISKKIKKDEKIKYIDQLTSLKNRNYLNENISAWNKNTIYPQAMIVVDLNKVQEINDVMGYEKGDTQIKASANVLIKTQLDNTDIIRTDGNEFLIYMVGYDERKVVSYIKKLSKEFKTLPYEYGAAIGYSMIVDDLKTIEDAINEAVEDMKTKKNNSIDNKE